VVGTCVCSNGFSYCAGQCSNTKNNPQHCGSCNVKCPQGKSCAGGVCM
jgi:hypothetical protein